jgi:hypothetical protein
MSGDLSTAGVGWPVHCGAILLVDERPSRTGGCASDHRIYGGSGGRPLSPSAFDGGRLVRDRAWRRADGPVRHGGDLPVLPVHRSNLTAPTGHAAAAIVPSPV